MLLSTSLLFAEDFNDLLNSYVKASELSNKTKNENAGNLIVYTRDDLERMQALTLKDLLKLLRYFSYSENRQVQSDLLNLDAFSNNSKGIRLYLNEHELLSPLYGSGFIYFGDMELEFIDHVEIYTGFPSFEFGIEPATVVIRLYTKSAVHDQGGKVKLLGGSDESHFTTGYYSDSFDDFSYFTYIGQYNNNRKEYSDSTNTLQRDQLRNRFYGSMSTENHSLELHAVQSENDAFLGKFTNAEIIDTSMEYQHISISTFSQFMDKSLTLKASYTKTDTEFEEHFNRPDFNITNLSARDKTKEESFTLSTQKKWDVSDHEISLGLEYRYKFFDIAESYFNDTPVNFHQAFDTEQIYSLYLQDLYNVTDNSLISLSLMNQFYERNGDVNEPDNLQLRLAYIYSDKAFTSKTTLSSQEFAAEPYTIISSGHGNVNLKSERYNSLAQELTYKTDNTLNNVLLSYARLSEYPIIGPSGRPENSDKEFDIYTATYEFTYYYSIKDKFEFQLNYSNSDTAYTNDKAKILSSLFRSLNTFGALDVFNELWIVSPAFSTEISVDYSAGLKYRVSRDFSFQIKGENIFDSAEKRIYFNGLDPDNNEIKSVQMSTIDRKVWFGLEYLF